MSDENDMGVVFEPDPEFTKRAMSEDSHMTPPDVIAFEKVLSEKMAVFLERREQYGSHLENAERFPLEDFCGLYLKCTRFIRMFEKATSGGGLKNIDPDTVIDCSNYADMIYPRLEGDG